jgi:agmatinase
VTSFAFLSQSTFLKASAASAQTPYAVAGIAWDGAVTNRPGARLGPRAIREASHMLCDAQHPHFDVSPLGVLGDMGDLPLPNTSLLAMRAALQPLVVPLLKAHHMCWLGGDHSVTLSLLRAYRQHLGRPLAVIHFDAHCDTWTTHFDEPSGHGTWVYEALQEGLVIDECFTQIGIRSSAGRQEREYVSRRGGQIFTARDLRGLESPAQLAGVLDAVRSRLAAHGHPPVYLSLDIDCLDPAFAPGTGTPEPGGLTTRELLRAVRTVTSELDVAAFDLVEVSPPYDHAAITAMAGHRVLLEGLNGMALRRAGRKARHEQP